SIFKPPGYQSRYGRQKKERYQGYNIAPPRDRASFPPENRQQGQRQRDNSCLTQQSQKKEAERQDITPVATALWAVHLFPASALVKLEIPESRREGKNSRESVFTLRNPRHRFHIHRVQSKDDCR